MVSSFLTRCHKILDKLKEVREAVGTVVCFLKEECSAVFIGHKELKMSILATNGDLDTFEDNGAYHIERWDIFTNSCNKKYARAY